MDLLLNLLVMLLTLEFLFIIQIIQRHTHVPFNYLTSERNGAIEMQHNLLHTIILLKSVGVRKRQVAILALSSQEMSLTVCIG